MKKLILILSFFTISFEIAAQTEKTINPSITFYNKYFISIDTNVIHNPQVTATYIKEVCAANTVNYNSKTKRDLRNV